MDERDDYAEHNPMPWWEPGHPAFVEIALWLPGILALPGLLILVLWF